MILKSSLNTKNINNDSNEKIVEIFLNRLDKYDIFTFSLSSDNDNNNNINEHEYINDILSILYSSILMNIFNIKKIYKILKKNFSKNSMKNLII